MLRQFVFHICLIFSVLFFLDSAFGQNNHSLKNLKSGLQIRYLQAGKLRLSNGKLTQTLDLSNDFSGCLQQYDGWSDPKGRKRFDSSSIEILDKTRKDGFYYIILGARLGSNCNVQGMCGAGTNYTLVWLKLNAKLEIEKKQAEVVEDCRADLIMTEPESDYESGKSNLKLIKGVLQVKYEKTDYREKASTVISYQLKYDRNSPEQGFIVSTKTEVETKN